MPSEKILQAKKEKVKVLAEKMQGAASVVLVDYKGISVSTDTSLRAEMRENGVTYMVEKNSILSHVFDATGLTALKDDLKGTVAIAFSADDAVAPARVLQKYADKSKDIFNLKSGIVDGKIVINPTAAQRAKSDLELTVAATAEKVVMIEAGAKEVDEDTMYEAIMKAHEAIKPLVAFINDIKAQIGKEKFAYPSCEIDHDMFDRIEALVGEDVKLALDTDDKKIRDARLQPLYDKVYAELEEDYPDSKLMINECMYKLQKKIVREWLKKDKRRVDGRRMDQIRPLAAEVGILPRTHGSAMFTRGQTQVMTIATLAPLREAQLLDGIDDEETKRYMHHYNMPGYSTGEAKATRSPGRREIGHGALAGRALEAVLPSAEEFPYAIRLVSEVVSSNGSTSQASVCGSTLALMDAGVPITAPVAGISCGLITDDDGSWATMIDIQGLEDFFGDMDFKVAGTKKGITAIQMDLKIDGLTPEIIRNALETTRKGRLYIIDDIILPCIPEPRSDVSKYAPKMISTKIEPDKIREVIGTGGKVIQKICADTGAQIDIEDDGSVFIAAVDKRAAYKALDIINAIVSDPEPGAIYTGKVTGIIPIGCFVEYAPGKEGLVHISKLDTKRVEKVEDVVHIGDEIKVMVLGVDNKGRINLSRRDLKFTTKRTDYIIVYIFSPMRFCMGLNL